MTDVEKCRLVLRAAEDEIDSLNNELATVREENRRLRSGLKHPAASILEYLEPAAVIDLAEMEVKGRPQ